MTAANNLFDDVIFDNAIFDCDATDTNPGKVVRPIGGYQKRPRKR